MSGQEGDALHENRSLLARCAQAWHPGQVMESPLYVNDGLTLDFDETGDPFPKLHFCFRVDPGAFDAILRRITAAGIPYRSLPHGPDDFKVNTDHGGRIVYWSEPGGHVWEALTVSYARRAG